MKKITLILSVFILILSSQSNAQEAVPAPQMPEQVEQNEVRNKAHHKRMSKKRRAHKREVQRRKAQHRKMRSMNRVARADGKVTQRERAVMRAERRKMQKRNKRRAIERRSNIHRSSRGPGGGL